MKTVTRKNNVPNGEFCSLPAWECAGCGTWQTRIDDRGREPKAPKSCAKCAAPTKFRREMGVHECHKPIVATTTMIQSLTEYPTIEAAYEALPGIRGLEDCAAARVIPAKRDMHGPAVQAFFPDIADPLPDGCRRVTILPGFLDIVRASLP